MITKVNSQKCWFFTKDGKDVLNIAINLLDSITQHTQSTPESLTDSNITDPCLYINVQAKFPENSQSLGTFKFNRSLAQGITI